MKKTTLLAILIAGVLLLPTLSMAQLTASGSLVVTATVESSIDMVFNNAGGGVTLGGAGTNAATLAFGTISAYGAIATPGVTRTAAANSFTVSSPFNVHVNANGGSPNYTLKATLAAADAFTWALSGTPVVNGSSATLSTNNGYGVDIGYTLALTVPFSSANGAVINNTINFAATAN